MMSHRGKRQAFRSDDVTPVATKRRKGRITAVAEEEETSAMDQRHPYTGASISSDIKMSTIYNRSVTDAPAELFRKDLISAMKLPDSEPLTSDHYWVITDQWKQEWERGVQVPVKPDSLPGPVVTLASTNANNARKMHHEFKLPKNKYIRITKDEHFRIDEHYLSNVGIQAEKCCAYDLEDVDVVWLNIVNGERALLGLPPITQDQLERVIEELEMRCWEKVHAIVKKEEGLALEYDESVICDVCRSPDSEEGNEMVFCDCCNICVHQACYGITSIPAGQWLCRTCSLGLRPECVLCPNKNGAMKSTRSGQKWAHVSCALWIPEVSIGCVEKMEPITKISSIPQSRWALICVLCRERVGACIQCSVKTCKTAYHVTCAFKHGLEMRAIIDEESTTDDDNTVKLRSYCQKHSISSKKDMTNVPGTNSDEEVKKKQRKDMTTEEKSHARAVKLQEIESEFEKHVSVKDITRKYDVDADGLEYIYNYWVLKRRASYNKPLLAPKSDDASDLLNKNQEQVDQEKMRMFVQLRQDLERVRNLCYMVSRREKLSRSYQRLREQTFYKQAALLSDTRISLSTAEITSIKEANHGPSIYDRLYSHANAPDLSTDFETMVQRIAGYTDSDHSPRRSVNGYIFSGKDATGKRSILNGDICGKSLSESMSSSSDLETKSNACLDTESDSRFKVNNRMNKSQRKNAVENRTKNTARRRKSNASATYVDTSSTENDDYDNKTKKRSKKATGGGSTTSSKKSSPLRRSFELLERRMQRSRSGSVTAADDDDDDSEDDLFNIINRNKGKGDFKKNAVSEIYSSDSDSSYSAKTTKEKSRSNDSRKPVPTKASVKQFTTSKSKNAGNNGINKSITSHSSSKSTPSSNEKRRRVKDLFDEESDASSKEDSKPVLDDKMSSSETDIVPQRKAAKMASETLTPPKSTKNRKDKKSPAYDTKKAIRKETPDNESKLSEHDKNTNYRDTLPLVPQRAAAKKAIKAIEHIKNGMVKPTTPFEETQPELFKGVSKTPQKNLKKESSHVSKKLQLDTEDKYFTGDKKSFYQKSTAVSISTETPSSVTSASTMSSAVCSAVSSISLSTPITTTCSTTAITSSTIGPSTISTAIAKTTTSSSGSSSGSSSSGSSSSSSSSSSGSSSSSSSSDSSSSGSSSSSSSSESESEDKPAFMKKKSPTPPPLPVPQLAEVPTPTRTPVHSSPVPSSKPMPKCRKRELERSIENDTASSSTPRDNKNDISVVQTNTSDDFDLSKSPYMDMDINKVKPPSPPILELSEKTDDMESSVNETESAIEHLTNNESDFLSPVCWETESAAASITSAPNDNLDKNLADSLVSLADFFNNDFAFKEDSKEDSKRETLNLVEKLRSELARKKTGDGIDSITSAPTPDVAISQASEDEEKMENESIDSHEIQSNTQSMPKENEVPLELLQTPLANALQDDSMNMYNSCSFPSDVLQPISVQPTIPEKSVSVTENITINTDDNNAVNWSQTNNFSEPDVASPYHLDDPNMMNRWSDNVIIPSRRSDCSSTSTSSGSSSSSAYCELPHQNDMISTGDGLQRNEQIPTLEISQEMQKSVADLLRPVNDNAYANSLPENVYPYQDHMSPFVTNKSMYDSHQHVTQPSPLFPTSAFDSSYAKAFGEPLMIQTPCAAAASFTTTSQNMAFTTSIISPIQPINTENTMLADGGTASTPTTDESGKLDTPQLNSIKKESADENEMFDNTTDMINSISTDKSNSSVIEKSEIEKTIDEVATLPQAVSTPLEKPVTPPSIPKLPTPVHQSVKKSPNKPTRVSARVMSQNKSPAAKSPMASGVSPARPVEPVPTPKPKPARKNHRANNKGQGRNSRGRGRGRGRHPSAFYYRDWDGDIHNKLVGTVYDFDDEDELSGDNFENLRAMRERRKSTDTAYCDKLSTPSKETCYSPKFASPSQQQQQQPPPSKRKSSTSVERRASHRTQLSPLCEISNNGRVITKEIYRDNVVPPQDDEEEPAEDEEEEEEEEEPEVKATAVSTNKTSVTSSPTLPQPPVQSTAVEQFAAVQPMLPGPVDMRTYSGSIYDTPTTPYDEPIGTAFPATKTIEPVNDIVDALEKEIERYSALPPGNRSKRSPDVARSPAVATDTNKSIDTLIVTNAASPATHYIAQNVEIRRHEATATLIEDENSLSRNQLKMKIKGPYSDANYVPVTIAAPIVVQPLPSANNGSFIAPNDFNAANNLNVSVSSAAAAASSSSYRRMRKKELLRQYCTQQDISMDECPNDMTVVAQQTNMPCEAVIGPPPNLVKAAPSYKLPKAVASMTTIPTKEDYKAVLDAAANIDKKKRGKEKLSAYDTADFSNNNNFIGSNNTGTGNVYNNVYNNKPPYVPHIKSPDKRDESDNHATKRKSRSTSSGAPPKLKIKIGGLSSIILDNNSSVSSFEEKNLRLRPPKKRLCDSADKQPSPATVEQLKRESMRYRSKVINEFNENGGRYEARGDYDFSDNDTADHTNTATSSTTKETAKKRRKRSSSNALNQKSSKRKKKQQKRIDDANDDTNDTPQVHVITNHGVSEGAPKKIIIKFGGISAISSQDMLPSPPPTKPPKSKRNMNHELDSVRTTKITPIRLKLSRSKEGLHVTKSSCVEETTPVASTDTRAEMLPKRIPSPATAETATLNTDTSDATASAASTSNTAS